MNKLKPCPFCGGEADMLTAESMQGGYLFGIMCNECRSRGDVYDTEAEAVAAWNTRYVRTCRDMSDTPWARFVCSECGGDSLDPALTYCPNCGAKVVRDGS